MDKTELDKWARKEGRALPYQKSSKKFGLKGSTALDRDTWQESYEALKTYSKLIYPDYHE